MSNNGDHVALTRCFFCGGPNEILLHRQLRSVAHLHDKVVNDRPCTKCADNMKIGVILISVRDATTEEEKKNPYRTGRSCVMKQEAAERVFGLDSPVLKLRCAFLTDETWVQLGLPMGNEDTTDPEDTAALEHGLDAVCNACGNVRKVRSDWSESENGTVIGAACIKCNPDDKTKLVPHALKKW